MMLRFRLMYELIPFREERLIILFYVEVEGN